MEEDIHYLYYVKIHDTISGNDYWKIGVENKQFNRWKDTVNFSIEYIWSVQSNKRSVLTTEATFIQEYKTGLKEIPLCFEKSNGASEALPYDFLKDVNKQVVKEKLQEKKYTIYDLGGMGPWGVTALKSEIKKVYPEVISNNSKTILTRKQGEKILNRLIDKYPQFYQEWVEGFNIGRGENK